MVELKFIAFNEKGTLFKRLNLLPVFSIYLLEYVVSLRGAFLTFSSELRKCTCTTRVTKWNCMLVLALCKYRA
jgi:hypothetical protein